MSDGPKITKAEGLMALLKEGADLRGLDAAGVELRGLDLSGKDLSGAKLRYTDLSATNLQRAIFHKANMRHARLLEADLRYADFRGADLGHADLHGAILGETRMAGCNVDGIVGVRTEVFFPMTMIDELLEAPGVELGSDELVIPGDGIEQYRIVTAYRLVAAEGGTAGDPKLVGRVLSLKQIKEHGGEVAGNSVIVGTASYRAIEGYIGIPDAAKARPAAQPVAAAAGAGDTGSTNTEKPPSADDEGTDMDLLKDFLLNKLE